MDEKMKTIQNVLLSCLLVLIIALTGCGGGGNNGGGNGGGNDGGGDIGDGIVPIIGPIDSNAIIVDKDHANAGNNLTTSGRGTADHPFKSIQHAICYLKTTLSTKSTVYVKHSATPYFEPYCMEGEQEAGITIAVSGTSAKPILISGFPGELMPVIDQRKTGSSLKITYGYTTVDEVDSNPKPLSGFLISTQHHQVSYVTIRGFEIRNTTLSGIMGNHSKSSRYCTYEYNHIHHCYGLIDPDNIGGIRLDFSEYATVRENIIHDIYGGRLKSNPITSEPYGFDAGIHGFRPSNCQIYNNEIYHVNKGIYIKQPDQEQRPGHRMYRNYIHDIEGSAFYVGTMGGNMPAINGSWFYENLVVGSSTYNLNSGIVAFTNSQTSDQPKGIYIYNNTFVRCSNLLLLSNHLDIEVYNNILVNPLSKVDIIAIDERYTAWKAQFDYFDYNLYNSSNLNFIVNQYGSDQHVFQSLTEWQTAFSSGIAADIMSQNPDLHSITNAPIFVNAAIGDYRLQSNSPGYGTGRNGQNMGAYPTGSEKIGPSWKLTGY